MRSTPERAAQQAAAADLSVIVVSWNVGRLLGPCLASVLRQHLPNGLEVWLVDNASTDGSPDMVAQTFPSVHLIRNSENRGYGAANNQGIRASGGRHVLILNPDTEILGGELEVLVRFLDQRPEVAVVGCPLVFADGRFQHSCFRFPGLWQALLDVAPLPARLGETRLNGRYPRAAYTRPMAIDHPLGACFALRRTGLLFDESYFMYAEEIDLCWRLRKAGWTIAYLPELTVLHHAGQSTRQVPLAMRRQLYRSRALFNRKHRGPAFNLAWRLLVRAGGAPLP